MDKSKENNKIDRALIVICFSVIVFCGYILSDGRWIGGYDDTSQLKAVGMVSISAHDVRRKHENGLSWSPAKAKDSVYEGDSIFTGAVSNAEVSLSGGNRLDIDPKSLVVIRTNGDTVELDLKYGAVAGKLSGDQKLIFHNSEGESEEVSGKDVEIRVTQNRKGKQAKVQVISGQMQVKNKRTGIIKTVQKDESLVVAKSEGPIADPAADPAADPVAMAAPTPSPTPKIAKILNPPILTYPAQNQIFIINSRVNNGHTIGFEWSGGVPYSSYDLQVSKTTDFQNLAVEEKLKDNKFETTMLTAGHYHWRVRGQVPNDPAEAVTGPGEKISEPAEAKWSEAKQFEVIEKALPRAPVVGPSVLMTNYVLPYSKTKLNDANIKYFGKAGVAISNSPKWAWTPTDEATAYEVETTTGSDFSSSQKFTATQNNFQMQALEPGVYKWHVRALLPGGQTSDPSPFGIMHVSLPPPLQGEAATTELNYVVHWSPLLFAASYEVEWASTPAFQKPAHAIAKKANYALLKSFYAKEGGLHWRVRALDKAGQPISAFSKSQMLRAEPILLTNKTAPIRTLASDDEGADSAMIVPLLREPRPNTSVVSLGQTEGFLAFRWKGQPQTLSRLEVSRSPDFSKVIMTTTTKQMVYVMDKPLPPGAIYWRVRSETPAGRSKWAAPSPFSVSSK